MGRGVVGELAGRRPRRVSPGSWPMRAARAGVFAAAGTGLGVTAHRLGGGMSPPLWLTGAAALGLFAVALAFTGARRGLPVITGLVLATQTVMHVAFSMAGMPGTAPTAGMNSGGSLLRMVLCHTAAHNPSAYQLAAARATLIRSHVTAPPASAVTTHTTMHAASMLTPSMALMMIAHLLAATVTAWWLARGERAVWRCARRVVETIRAAAEGAPVAATRTANTAVCRSVIALAGRWRMLCAPGRAPPVAWFDTLLPACA